MAILSIRSSVTHGYAGNSAAVLSPYLETGGVKHAPELTAGSIYGVMEAAFKARSGELCNMAAQNELTGPSRSFTAVRL
ncbi:MAG: hypothetical protein LBG08_04455 [Spirochaetaceae bacterium]|nr:hypothetical protein [Spirochaetaceae bacterium]